VSFLALAKTGAPHLPTICLQVLDQSTRSVGNEAASVNANGLSSRYAERSMPRLYTTVEALLW
jgi:hypothetical protein